MKHVLVLLLFPVFMLVSPPDLRAQEEVSPETIAEGECTLELLVTGAIGASTLDHLQRGFEQAKTSACSSVLLLINTPGGSLQSTRLIVEEILASPVPVLCLVHPSGGHAGSAGAIILQACHVNGAVNATNIGAATPILGQGQDMPEDLRKKVINDTVSWLEGIAKLRGRDLDFVRDIVTEAKAVDAQVAAKAGAIDVVVNSKEEFLEFAEGRQVQLSLTEEVAVVTGPLVRFEQDLRFKILDIVGDPQFAYLLFMGSLALLYFEITNPGTIVAGVLGGIGLIFSLITFHKLNVWWGGLLLMCLGVGLMIAEAFVASFGILGLGGMVAFALGSIFLFDLETSGFTLPLTLILPTTLVLGGIFIGLSYMALRSLKVRKRGGKEALVGRRGRVISILPQNPREGQVEVFGEIWRYKSREDVELGSQVVVERVEGLTVLVRRLKETEQNNYG